MSLKDVIAALDAEPDKDRVLPFGFGDPHSYRGDYSELEFSPASNITVAEMLNLARSCVGMTVHGYKGGEYVIHDWTRVWLGRYGECDGTEDAMGVWFMRLLLAQPVPEVTSS